MIEHAPNPDPTFYPSDPEAPPGYQAPEGFPEAAPGNIADVDPNSPLRLSQQIEIDSMQPGREHFQGLSWLDENGVTHVVRDFEVRHLEVGTDHAPAGLSKVVWERRRRMIVGPSLPDARWPHGKMWPFEERKPRGIYRETPTVSIDEYDANGNLLHVRQASEEGLMRHLDEFGTADGNFWWQEAQEEPATDRIIPITVPTDAGVKPAPSVFDAITRAQRLNELDDWSGLKYSLRGQEVTVDREISLRVRTTNGWKHERAFIVKRFGSDGLEEWKTMKVDAFKKELDGITDNHGRTERADLNLRFEVPSVSPRVFLQRWIGQTLLEDRRNQNVGATPEVGANMADLLSYADIYAEGSRELENKRRETREHSHSWAYADTLRVIATELDEGDMGTRKLIDLAIRIKDNYLVQLRKTGLSPSPEDQSISWVLWDLAKQRYLADNPGEVRPKDRGMETGNAAGYDIIARNKQRDLIYHRIGMAFDKEAVVRHQEEPKEKTDYLPNGAVKWVQDEHGLRPSRSVVAPWHIDLAKEPMQNLNGVIREKVRKILGKVTAEDLELSYADHVEVGRLLEGQ
ncbi:MAG TPA: hypothetical protein VII55_02230 [Candidatus Saccharimonadales bacterium]